MLGVLGAEECIVWGPRFSSILKRLSSLERESELLTLGAYLSGMRFYGIGILLRATALSGFGGFTSLGASKIFSRVNSFPYLSSIFRPLVCSSTLYSFFIDAVALLLTINLTADVRRSSFFSCF